MRVVKHNRALSKILDTIYHSQISVNNRTHEFLCFTNILKAQITPDKI
jgi:hypothetical protein